MPGGRFNKGMEPANDARKEAPFAADPGVLSSERRNIAAMIRVTCSGEARMERQWSGNARRLSQADRLEIERRIWGGETFETAAAAVGCSTKSIQRFLALTGGLKRRVKERSALRLSLGEREEISRGLTAGDSLRAIARRLRRAPSTISRDV